ncbi:MAG: hypothetical protein U0Z53_29360 [Blastocatellia bacterium]
MRSLAFTLALVFLLAGTMAVPAQNAPAQPPSELPGKLPADPAASTPEAQADQKKAAAQTPDKNKQAPPEKKEPFKTPDRPLGAAGPSKDENTPGDGDYRVIEDRWRIGLPSDPRYVRGSILNPYRQNVLKGDYPIIGQHVFLNVTLSSESTLVLRRLPVPQDVSSQNPGSFEFFGRGRQEFFNQNFFFSFDLFHGDTSFKPADWRLHITPVLNINYLRARENGIVNIDVREGKTRLDGFVGFEELSYEMRLGDTTKIFPFLRGKGSVKGRSPSFDTTSVRVGVQQFNSDFRGFIFNDANLGVRLFGNYQANRYQFNVAYFNMLEKETNSELNMINFRDLAFRDQKVWIANLYRQDTFVKGYTAQLSLHYNTDQPSVHYDENGFLVRPAKIGDVAPHHVRTGYLGWTGDGHFGRVNITHAFYEVLGRDTRNPIASRATHINAQMAAAEVSVDRDWLRLRGSVFYTSGDSKPTDGTARGFDSILDNSSFAGGKFSFWSSQGIRLTQTGVALVEPHSLIPSLRSSKIEGQSNFVNPGLTIYNLGLDADITPKLRGFLNYNYLRFNRTEPLELVLFQPGIRHEIGHDLGLGFIYRPPLTENIIITGGVSGLLPGRGFTDIYSSNCNGTPQGCGAGRPPLWATFLSVKFTY